MVARIQRRLPYPIHRIQGYELTRDLIVSSRALGFESINLDLIYGLPFQTTTSFAETDTAATGTPRWVSRRSRADCRTSRPRSGNRDLRQLGGERLSHRQVHQT